MEIGLIIYLREEKSLQYWRGIRADKGYTAARLDPACSTFPYDSTRIDRSEAELLPGRNYAVKPKTDVPEKV